MSDQKILSEVIQWNKKEFFRAINDERFDDAKRFKDNIEKLERLVSNRQPTEREDTQASRKDKERKSTYGGL